MTAYGTDAAYQHVDGTGSKVVRRLLIVVGVIVILNVAAAVLRPWLDPQTDGPFGSTFVTTEQGIGAWHDVLLELGTATERLREPLPEAPPPQEATVVVFSPDSALIDADYAAFLLRHAEDGGRVLLVDVRNTAQLFDLGVEFRSAGRHVGPVDADPAFAADVVELSVPSGEALGGGEPLVTTPQGAVVSRFAVGRGDIVVAGSATMFTNAWIGEADNAVLAVRLVGDGPVVFDEYVHGFGIDQGWQGLGAVLRRVGLVALLAALLAMWAVGARLGPVEQETRALPPPRAAYIDSLAVTLSKTRDVAAFHRLKTRASHTVDRIALRYVGLPSAEQRRKAAAQLGLDDDDLAVLDREDIGDVMELASVAAKIERSGDLTTDIE